MWWPLWTNVPLILVPFEVLLETPRALTEEGTRSG